MWYLFSVTPYVRLSVGRSVCHNLEFLFPCFYLVFLCLDSALKSAVKICARPDQPPWSEKADNQPWHEKADDCGICFLLPAAHSIRPAGHRRIPRIARVSNSSNFNCCGKNLKSSFKPSQPSKHRPTFGNTLLASLGTMSPIPGNSN